MNEVQKRLKLMLKDPMDVYEIKEALGYTHIGKLLKKYSGSDGILKLQAEIIGRVSKEIMCDD